MHFIHDEQTQPLQEGQCRRTVRVGQQPRMGHIRGKQHDARLLQNGFPRFGRHIPIDALEPGRGQPEALKPALPTLFLLPAQGFHGIQSRDAGFGVPEQQSEPGQVKHQGLARCGGRRQRHMVTLMKVGQAKGLMAIQSFGEAAADFTRQGFR